MELFSKMPTKRVGLSFYEFILQVSELEHPRRGFLNRVCFNFTDFLVTVCPFYVNVSCLWKLIGFELIVQQFGPQRFKIF